MWIGERDSERGCFVVLRRRLTGTFRPLLCNLYGDPDPAASVRPLGSELLQRGHQLGLLRLGDDG